MTVAAVNGTAPRALPSTTAHLDAMVATGGDGYLILSAVGARGWRSAAFTVGQVDAAARWAVDRDDAGLNVYVRHTLLRRPLRTSTERGSTADTGCAVALVVDLDVAGPGHHQSGAGLPLPPDIDTAMSVVAELPPPSMHIDTGGGSHLWYLLDEPVVDDPVGLIDTWAGRVVEAGRTRGWHVDRPDAARVLRVCGTHRRKPGLDPNRVVMADVAGWPADGLSVRPWVPTGRYGASELLEALPEPAAPAPPPPPPRQRATRPGVVTPADAVSQLPWAKILEPYGWTHVGAGRMGDIACELWQRPGTPTSTYSLKAIPDGPCVVWSDAAGLPVGRDQRLSKFKVWCHLAGLTGGDATRLVGARARAIRS